MKEIWFYKIDLRSIASLLKEFEYSLEQIMSELILIDEAWSLTGIFLHSGFVSDRFLGRL